MKTGIHALAVAGLLLAGCQQAPQDTAAAEATLREGTKTWLEAHRAGDADGVAALYAADAVVFAPGRPASVGRDQIREMVAADIAAAQAAGITLMLGEADSLGVSGELGWHSGSYTATDVTGAVVDSGNYVEVWQNVDGQWQIIRDIWNSDRPSEMPEAGAPAEQA